MKTFFTGYLCWFIKKKLYDSMLPNEHIKLLADHYNVQQDSFVLIFYLSFVQLPVSIKNHKLKPEIIKNQEILNILKTSWSEIYLMHTGTC